MGACLSKKKDSSTPSPPPHSGSKSLPTPPSQLNNSNNAVIVTQPDVVNPKKENKITVQEKQQLAQKEDDGQVKKEIFIIKHRKSHDDNNNKETISKIQPFIAQTNVQPQQNDGSPSPSVSTSSTFEASQSMGGSGNGNNNKIAPSTPNMSMVRTSSCTKDEVDAILIQCGRLSRSSSGRAATSSGGRKYSGSKRSFDFDHCDNNDAISAEEDQKKANANDEECDGKSQHQHRQRHRQSPKKRGSSPSSSQGRRRTPSRERDQQHQNQRSSSRERRVSRSPGRRSSETNASNNNNNTGSIRPGKMVSVPATVTSLVMDKSNNGGGVGESASGVKRVTVKRNVGDGTRGAASPRSQSPARANSPAKANANQQHQQQQPSLSRNNSGRKAEQSPYRRNPLSEIDPNSLSYPQSNNNNSSSKVQNKAKREAEAEANQKPNVDLNENIKNRMSSRGTLEKGVSGNCKTKEQHQEEEIKAMTSMIDNVVVKNVIPSGAVDNLKQPQTLTRSRSARRSRDLDLNPESLLNPTQTYTSLLLEDIQRQKSTQQQPSISLPACLTKACSILEAVADLNSTTSSNFSDDRRSPPTYQSIRNNNNEHNVTLSANHYGKKLQLPGTKDHPFVESELVVSDDVMEPSLHKYVTVKRGGSIGGGVDMEDIESSGSNSFTVSNSGQNHWSNISSSWEPNSADSTDCWTSRLNEMEGSSDMKKTFSSKRRECDHQHSNGIGRGRLGSKGLQTLPVITTAAST
ncbi:hypothetical protein RIF29_17288 [Crotalaria pallida]|uniref:Uncharacterized protein n=1 Tax=Crotalaria pallida TaxID=3830 RepID=A0AAN9FI53_CROPI